MQVFECGDYGSLKYEMPDITGYLELLGSCGMSAVGIAEGQEMNDLVLTARLIRGVKSFVKTVDIKIGEKVLSDYDDLLKHREMLPHLMGFSVAVQNAFNEVEEEKK